jgi:hypothetical protein
MKIPTKTTILLILSAATTTSAFQWMSKFKMPTYDPQQELVQEKFGDKSAYEY